MRVTELAIGTRFLYAEHHNLREAKLLEISPSKLRVKLEYPGGCTSWLDSYATENLVVVEPLSQIRRIEELMQQAACYGMEVQP